jgi:hypothetical protein
LFSDLWRETSTLLRDEAELARTEIAQKVSQVETGFVSLAAGGVIVFAGFLVLLSAAVAGLAHALPPEQADWLSPLIVGAIVLIAGWITLVIGRRKLKAGSLAPERTIRSVRRDTQLAKEHIT